MVECLAGQLGTVSIAFASEDSTPRIFDLRTRMDSAISVNPLSKLCIEGKVGMTS